MIQIEQPEKDQDFTTSVSVEKQTARCASAADASKSTTAQKSVNVSIGLLTKQSVRKYKFEKRGLRGVSPKEIKLGFFFVCRRFYHINMPRKNRVGKTAQHREFRLDQSEIQIPILVYPKQESSTERPELYLPAEVACSITLNSPDVKSLIKWRRVSTAFRISDDEFNAAVLGLSFKRVTISYTVGGPFPPRKKNAPCPRFAPIPPCVNKSLTKDLPISYDDREIWANIKPLLPPLDQIIYIAGMRISPIMLWESNKQRKVKHGTETEYGFVCNKVHYLRTTRKFVFGEVHGDETDFSAPYVHKKDFISDDLWMISRAISVMPYKNGLKHGTNVSSSHNYMTDRYVLELNQYVNGKRHGPSHRWDIDEGCVNDDILDLKERLFDWLEVSSDKTVVATMGPKGLSFRDMSRWEQDKKRKGVCTSFLVKDWFGEM
jgi:hypothetical protein